MIRRIYALLRLFGWKASAGFPGLDPGFYLRQNPDIDAAGVDPWQHFMEHGWKESRSPSNGFSVIDYFEANPDVEAAGVNPLQHYLNHGLAEGRLLGLKSGQAAPHQRLFNELHGAEIRERVELLHRAPPQQRGRVV